MAKIKQSLQRNDTFLTLGLDTWSLRWRILPTGRFGSTVAKTDTTWYHDHFLWASRSPLYPHPHHTALWWERSTVLTTLGIRVNSIIYWGWEGVTEQNSRHSKCLSPCVNRGVPGYTVDGGSTPKMLGVICCPAVWAPPRSLLLWPRAKAGSPRLGCQGGFCKGVVKYKMSGAHNCTPHGPASGSLQT